MTALQSTTSGGVKRMGNDGEPPEPLEESVWIPSWFDQARCLDADPDSFFPDRGDNASHVEAVKRICAHCRIQARCLEFSLEPFQPFGVWGMHSAQEREQIAKRRGLGGRAG